MICLSIHWDIEVSSMKTSAPKFNEKGEGNIQGWMEKEYFIPGPPKCCCLSAWQKSPFQNRIAAKSGCCYHHSTVMNPNLFEFDWDVYKESPPYSSGYSRQWRTYQVKIQKKRNNNHKWSRTGKKHPANKRTKEGWGEDRLCVIDLCRERMLPRSSGSLLSPSFFSTSHRQKLKTSASKKIQENPCFMQRKE